MKAFGMENVRGGYAWIWLPGQTAPVVAGEIVKDGPVHRFAYVPEYRQRPDAIPLSPLELPLQAGVFEPSGVSVLHSCLRDAGPDAWGRRVINYRYADFAMDELDYLLLAASDRIGALDFQVSPIEYVPRETGDPDLDDLLHASQWVERGEPLPLELQDALLPGTGVGGARPKALFNGDGNWYIAKFNSMTDRFDLTKAEYVTMRLARLAGIDAARVSLVETMGQGILLVERFDRHVTPDGVTRRLMLSGLSLLGLSVSDARFARYSDLAEVIRQRFEHPQATLEELYKRLALNVLVGNTDDHARNYAAFWDGETLALTPAYDICPHLRTTDVVTQAMMIDGVEGDHSTLRNVLSVCDRFGVSREHARSLINDMIGTIQSHWKEVCEEADLLPEERDMLWQHAVLNPFCLKDW